MNTQELRIGNLVYCKAENGNRNDRGDLVLLRQCDQTGQIVSRKLYLSVPRTIHVVKEETGHTFQQLRKAYQMRLAAARLRFSNESLSHVAVQCGFDNVSSLHRNFKKYFNLTPLAYRKQYDSDNEKFSDIIDTGDWPGRPY